MQNKFKTILINGQEYTRFCGVAPYSGFVGQFTFDDYYLKGKIKTVIGSSGDDIMLDEDEEFYLECYIKWDGCSTFNFDNTGVHICGKPSYQSHCQLMMELFEFASLNIKYWGV
jgi:hypothetical protein